ncbi:MAG: LemA family protein [Candidatus Aureabacteria bacterium]|nr:LemA family protein [Candidatus Auribacterota bacterium]
MPILIAIPLICIWAALAYNRLVRLRNHCTESWSGIDTELKRRYDQIPNLVAAVKGYAAHEREVLELVVQARSAAVASTGSPAAQAADENVLVGGLRRLLAVAENYPDLKASRNFLDLQEELANTEDRIQRARRFYNANVRELNTRVEVFPSNIIAGVFGVRRREYFEIDDAIERKPPGAILLK